MSPFRGQYPNQSPDTACIENRGNGTSVFRDVFGRTRTEVQALPTASLLSCERNDVIEPRQQWGAYGERCSLKMDKATAPPLGSYIYIYNPSIRKKGGLRGLLNVCLIGRSKHLSPYYRGICVWDKDFRKFPARKLKFQRFAQKSLPAFVRNDE